MYSERIGAAVVDRIRPVFNSQIVPHPFNVAGFISLAIEDVFSANTAKIIVGIQFNGHGFTAACIQNQIQSDTHAVSLRLIAKELRIWKQKIYLFQPVKICGGEEFFPLESSTTFCRFTGSCSVFGR